MKTVIERMKMLYGTRKYTIFVDMFTYVYRCTVSFTVSSIVQVEKVEFSKRMTYPFVSLNIFITELKVKIFTVSDQ